MAHNWYGKNLDDKATLAAALTTLEAAGGASIPAGGTTGQALEKNSNTDFDLKWATVSGGGSSLVPTAVKSGNYTASAGDLVPCDISAGSFTITLPTTPADQTQVCVEIVARASTGAPFYVTVATGGSDVLFKTSGPTTGIMGRGSVILQYNASGAIWYAPGVGDLLPTGWEFGYDQITSNAVIGSSTEASGTAIISAAAHVFDGSPVVAQFFATVVDCGSVGSNFTISLFESSTQIGRLAVEFGGNASAGTPVKGELRFTPTAASHTYTVTAICGTLTGPPTVFAGAGGTGAYNPAFLRFTKV